MFTNLTAAYMNGDILIEAACLSTDTKPTTDVPNGSSFLEMDTGNVYMWDEENEQWRQL